MKISVIIPTYKPDYYIWECLNSLKKQTVSQDSFEVLIILNGDKEPYYSQISDWINKNEMKNIRLLYSEKKGVSSARNLGLDTARGENICFIDDDDYIDNNYLEELVKGIERYGQNGIVITNYMNFDEKTKENLYETKHQNGFYTKNILEIRKVFSMGCMKLIPKNIIRNIRFKNYSNGEDSLFMLEISKNINYISFTEKNVLYHRRVRKNSANYKSKKISYILKNSFNLLNEYVKIFFKKGYNKKFIFIRILAVIKGLIFQLVNYSE